MKIIQTWITDEAVWVRREDGVDAFERFADYPRLRDATPEQRAHFVMDAFGINWPELDEDLSFEGFFLPKKESMLYRIFILHPELNASAIARRIGISQSLFAQYISGIKTPSQKRLDEILNTLHNIGEELVALSEPRT